METTLTDYLGADPANELRRILELRTLAGEWSYRDVAFAGAKLRRRAARDGLMLVTDEDELRRTIDLLAEQEPTPPGRWLP